MLVDRQQLDTASGALVESAVEHHVAMAGGDAASSLEPFAGSDDLEALRNVLERTRGPGTADEETVTRGDAPPAPARRRGNKPKRPREATHLDLNSGDASHGTLIYDGVSAGGQAFQVLRPLARGGLGEVFVARDGRLNREVALKLIEESQAADPQSRARFLLEAEITGGLEHPGIVPVYALGENSDGRLFYAMRLVRGETLKERIRKFHNAGSISRQPLPFRQLLNHFVRICDIIAYAHSRGVLHRDLKPSNVMLGKFGETLVVDWGLAKTDRWRRWKPAGRARRTEAAADLGQQREGNLARGDPGDTAIHEPRAGAGPARAGCRASDVYGLGATLYCILTGSPPLGAMSDVGAVLSRVALGDIPPPRSLRPDVPATLEAICKKAMAVRPEDRYASVRSLAADIESWLADEPVQGVAEPVASRLAAWDASTGRFFVSAPGASGRGARGRGGRPLRQCRTRVRRSTTAGSDRAVADCRRPQARGRPPARCLAASHHQADARPGVDPARKRQSPRGVLWLARSLENASGQHDPLEPAIRANLAPGFP